MNNTIPNLERYGHKCHKFFITFFFLFPCLYSPLLQTNFSLLFPFSLSFFSRSHFSLFLLLSRCLFFSHGYSLSSLPCWSLLSSLPWPILQQNPATHKTPKAHGYLSSEMPLTAVAYHRHLQWWFLSLTFSLWLFQPWVLGDFSNWVYGFWVLIVVVWWWFMVFHDGCWCFCIVVVVGVFAVSCCGFGNWFVLGIQMDLIGFALS